MYPNDHIFLKKKLILDVKINLGGMYDWYFSAHEQQHKQTNSAHVQQPVNSHIQITTAVEISRRDAFISHLIEKSCLDQKMCFKHSW